MNKAEQLFKLGQSIWFDNIERSLLDDGSIAAMIDSGKIYGITSNPSIFEKAIGGSAAYDDVLQAMSWAGMSSEQIYLQLVVSDIQRAADLFKGLYLRTNGGDGFVSLEVSPLLARDTEGTIKDARALWAQVARPNLMVKVPATREGIPAIETLVSEGININATLIFSIEQYQAVMEAYLRGLESRLARHESVDNIASVASFFVSRIDSAVDKLISERGADPEAGRTAVDNAKLAYQAYKEVFEADRFAQLAAAGARPQRPLWASTGTKNPTYSDVLYVDKLTAAGSVNTAPPDTVTALLDHMDSSRLQIEDDLDGAVRRLEALEAAGISLRQVTADLEADGVLKFQESFESLMHTIDTKRQAFLAQLGPLAAQMPGVLKQAANELYVSRLYDHDPSLWTADTAGYDEIRERLGWLDLPAKQFESAAEYTAFAQDCLRDGLRYAFVLGMGGSSLAPEVLSLAVCPMVPEGKGMRLAIIDTTNPDEIQERLAGIPLEQTLFLVSSKSGTTSETNAAFHYFWEKCQKASLPEPGSHFVAITDPGTSLEKLAAELKFRSVFKAPADVGGRYSVFTAFGLVPAALMGIDLGKLLNKAATMAAFSGPEIPYPANPSLMLGLVLGQAALNGQDKLTFLTDGFAGYLVPWLEQLIAESTGKEGKGILPIEAEPLQSVEKYRKDRIFTYLHTDGENLETAKALVNAGFTVLVYHLQEPYDLGREFFRWEYATAVASAKLKVNAFDQPNVQDNKTITKTKISEYQNNGRLSEGKPIWENEEAAVYGSPLPGLDHVKTLAELLDRYAEALKPDGYITLSAYLARNAANEAALQKLRARLLEKTKLATTLGFGPRFLHSTGQLHKGGLGGGLFVILTSDPKHDLNIPQEGMSFGTLQKAQALGDLEALRARDKFAIRVHLKDQNLQALVK